MNLKLASVPGLCSKKCYPFPDKYFKNLVKIKMQDFIMHNNSKNLSGSSIITRLPILIFALWDLGGGQYHKHKFNPISRGGSVIGRNPARCRAGRWNLNYPLSIPTSQRQESIFSARRNTHFQIIWNMFESCSDILMHKYLL